MEPVKSLKKNRVVIMGASSGIGKAVAQYLEPKVTELVTISRSPSAYGRWIRTDVSQFQDIQKIKEQLNNASVDALLYLGGTWEKYAFTEAYNFEASPDEELRKVLDVNLLGPIRLIQALLPNLRRSDNARIVLMGALVRDYPSKEVANTASKFGLNGVVNALRKSDVFKKNRIGITVIHPGDVATPEVLKDLQQAGKPMDHAIPLDDMCTMIHCLLSLSNLSNVNEVAMASMLGIQDNR